jgi:hypothetical protein
MHLGLCSEVSSFHIKLLICSVDPRSHSIFVSLFLASFHLHFLVASPCLSFHFLSLTSVVENRELRFFVLTCMNSVDRTFRKKEGGSYNPVLDYERYSAADGVHRMQCRAFQANFLEDKPSPDARLFYLAFTFVDGTDGIANGIARCILSYVGRNKSEDEV